MSAPVCRCGHAAKEHAHGEGKCWQSSSLADCACWAFVPDAAPVALPRGTSDRCLRCGTTHALEGVALPWCPVDGRKGADDAF